MKQIGEKFLKPISRTTNVTRLVSSTQGRNYLGYIINHNKWEIANQRIHKYWKNDALQVFNISAGPEIVIKKGQELVPQEAWRILNLQRQT